MTAPLFLCAPGELAECGPGDRLEIGGAEGHHAVRVRRLRAGEAVLVADGNGWVSAAVVESVGTDSLIMRCESVDYVAPRVPRWVLVQALAKGERDDQAIEAATELGVDEVVPWQAERCVVRWRGERGERAWGKWEAVLVAASKQSRRARLPVLSPLMSSGQVADRIAHGSTAYLLDADAEAALAQVDLPAAGDIIVIVGPEGGITAAELNGFIAAGAQPVRLGDTVLRSSSAGPAALAVLAARSRWQ